MKQSENTQGAVPQNLKEEAETLLLKHFRARHIEAMYEAKEALDSREASLHLRAPYRAPITAPWVSAMMLAAVMPDGTLNTQIVRDHAINHSEMVTIQTGPAEPSLELRKEMEANGCIWGYHADADEDEEQYYHAEVTGYGLAKFLGIDLHKYMADQRATPRPAA